jgi:hypothetical protein
MTTKTRNESIALVVILLVLGYLLYHFFLSGSSTPVAVNTTTVMNSTTGSTSGSPNQFLPNGSTLDTSVLQNPTFTSLVPLPQFSVSQSQLGVTNPFAPVTTAQ